MTDVTPVAPTASNPMEMVVTTNTAPVEQKSTEMVTIEPKTELPVEKPASVAEPVEEPLEPIEPEPFDQGKANDLARKALEDKIRLDDAERRLKEFEPKTKEIGTRPKIEDFDTLENFEKALFDYARETGKQEERNFSKQAEDQRKQLAVKTAVAAKEQESRKKHSDFDQVVSPIIPIIGNIPILKDFLANNPMGTEVIYELGKNPAVLEQIMRSDTWAAGEQLLNLAARLKKPATVSITNAPEPIKTVGSRETVKLRLGELAMKDTNGYIALRNKQELARKRAN